MALPSIQRELHASVSGLQWTIDAYTLVIACLLMLSGSLADRFGRRRVFQIGLELFSLGSLPVQPGAVAGLLVAFRGLQAVGGSMLNPVAMSIITNIFIDRASAPARSACGARGRLSLALGPVLGGLLVEPIGWRAIFWINVPSASPPSSSRTVRARVAGRRGRGGSIRGQLLVIICSPA